MNDGDASKDPLYRLPTDLPGDIEDYARDVGRFLDGSLEGAIFKAKRVPRGVYEQREDGVYMVRIRIPAGTVGAQQARRVAELAGEFGEGSVHVTTRQDLQLHDVKIEDTPEIMRRLYAVGLTSKGGGGNTVRNVAACPYTGICRQELFDVTPFAHAVTEYLIPLVGSYNLPRKYKIAFSGCDTDCALAHVNDLGFVAGIRDGKPGFVVRVGGGMGAHSRLADPLLEWTPAGEVIRIAETVRRLFDRYGDRENRNRARLRFVLERMGLDAFRRFYDDEFQRVVDEGIPACAIEPVIREETSSGNPPLEEDSAAGLRTIPQLQKGLYAVRLHLPLGFLSSHDLARIAEMAGEFSQEQGLRTMRSQDLLIRDVRKEDLEKLGRRLADELDEDLLTRRAIERFTACAGASTCRLGLCLARGAASACAAAMDEKGIAADVQDGMRVNISGCPNACGQHPVSPVGLYGAALRGQGGLIPGYRVVLGAIGGIHNPSLANPVGTVPARNLPRYLVRLANDYAACREPGESFSAYVGRRGVSYFEVMLANFEELPAAGDHPEFYQDWGSREPFSLAGRGAGECGAGVFEVIRNDISMARKHLKQAGDGGSAETFAALLAASRALLITRGVDSGDKRDVLGAFETHFIDTGLVEDSYRCLVAQGREYVEGGTTALDGQGEQVRRLIQRVEKLFGCLDGNLVFNVGATRQAASPETGPEKGAGVSEMLDLTGVACPMNYVKAKLKLETMEEGSMLTVVLDDGEPARNVPASFRQDGQEVVSETDVGNGQWKIVICKQG